MAQGAPVEQDDAIAQLLAGGDDHGVVSLDLVVLGHPAGDQVVGLGAEGERPHQVRAPLGVAHVRLHRPVKDPTERVVEPEVVALVAGVQQRQAVLVELVGQRLPEDGTGRIQLLRAVLRLDQQALEGPAQRLEPGLAAMLVGDEQNLVARRTDARDEVGRHDRIVIVDREVNKPDPAQRRPGPRVDLINLEGLGGHEVEGRVAGVPHVQGRGRPPVDRPDEHNDVDGLQLAEGLAHSLASSGMYGSRRVGRGATAATPSVKKS